MAGWTSLSPNFCEIRVSGEIQILDSKWNTLEDSKANIIFLSSILHTTHRKTSMLTLVGTVNLRITVSQTPFPRVVTMVLR